MISVVGTGTVTYSLSVVGRDETVDGTVSFQDSHYKRVPITLPVKGSSGDNPNGDVALKIISPMKDGSFGSHYDFYCE
jgi:hypothetical protein